MPRWLEETLEKSAWFMPHGHCYLWIPWLLWLHVISDLLIGVAYVGISLILWGLVRRLRLPFSPVFIAFGLFIGLCGMTHFMKIWTVWTPDYVADGLLKAATAIASVATAIGLVYVKPQIERVVRDARLSEERRIRMEAAHAELETMFDRVKELDALRTRFFANVSHELRTPLALILGPAERLLAEPGLDDAQRRQLRSIQANGQTLLRHVNDLLDLARMEAGRAQLDYARVDAAAWFRRVCSQFELAAEQRGIELRVDMPAQLIAEFDAPKLERVLVNLLSNAFKFTPDGGRVAAGLADDAHWVRLSVADSGPGVPPGQRETVFERFRQADAEATRARGGTGLGLAIAREFVELHGGHVEVTDSALGGALFLAAVPARAPAGRAVHGVVADDGTAGTALAAALHELDTLPEPSVEGTAAHAVEADADTCGHVLVVEDNPEMRAFVAGTLSSRFRVSTAADGVDGLEQARTLKPDLVVSDLMMPRMSGDQLVVALRADPAFATLPVLLLTAHADDAMRVQLLGQGAQDYLTKPFAADELLVRAGNLVQSKRAGDALRADLQTVSTDLADLAVGVAAKNRQLATALEAAEFAHHQAEQASRAKTEFLAMMSHELRSPLTTLHLNLHLLQREAELPPRAAPRLERLSRSTAQMSGLIESLLDYSRMEAGHLTATPVAVEAVALARDVLEAHRGMAQGDVALEIDAPASLDVTTDPDLLRLVLSKLLSNALKFTREGHVRLRVGTRDGRAVLEVEDTGPGIAADDLDRIFEPFEQGEALHRKTQPGIGLGLALVRRTAEVLGATVEVESTPHVGSRFRLVLPEGSA